MGRDVEMRCSRLERHDESVFCTGLDSLLMSYHGIGGREAELGKVWVRLRVVRALSGVYGYWGGAGRMFGWPFL